MVGAHHNMRNYIIGCSLRKVDKSVSFGNREVGIDFGHAW